MNELVFIEPNKIDSVPFTTSKVISECAGIGHRHIKKQIELHESALRSFGLLVAHATESTGGRPEEIIILTEEQATLLITFLKNTEPVVKFKTELVRQFFLMKNELMKRQVFREQLKPIRREMTDAINDLPDRSEWAYNQYTDLAYKAVTGKIARVIRKERGAKQTDKAVDYMTSAELEQITKRQYQIAVLIESGFGYHQIKDILLSGHTVKTGT